MDFKWDLTSRVAGYTEPQYYACSNLSRTVEKKSNQSCIYNVECSPPQKTTSWFTFTMRIDAVGASDDWNALGIIECTAGKRTHARQKGTYFFFENVSILFDPKYDA